MKDGVEIYGGFAGTETALSQRTDFGTGGVNETILSGDIGVADDQTDNCYHIFYHPNSYGLTSTAKLNGFTIKYGYADDNSGVSHLYRGGGMYNGSGNNPAIEYCTFNNNYAGNGGGLYVLTSSPSISNIVFSNNTAGNLGGGMYMTTSANPVITNCLVVNNNAVATGGGIYLYATDIATDACNPVITNTTIVNNSANLCGGVRVLVSTVTLNNCIIWGNTDINAGDGNQIYMSGTGSSTTLNYSCYSNSLNDIYGTLTTSNCITTDPEFIGSGDYPFSILGSSPCADAGNDIYNTYPYDIRGTGFARKLNKDNGAVGTIDMGAYENKFGDDPLPVELSSFSVTVSGNSVHLDWQTATEVNNYGFEVERTSPLPSPYQGEGVRQLPDGRGWETIGFVAGAGNSNSIKEYRFIDNTPVAERSRSYRLKQIDLDGSFKYSKEISVDASTFLPTEFALKQNYPNPFNPVTTIKYSLPSPLQGEGLGVRFVSLVIFNLLGQEVATLVNTQQPAGNYEVKFDASNLASGIYIYRMQSGEFTDTKKMLLLK